MKFSIQRITLGAALCALSVVGVQSQVTIDAFSDPGVATSVQAQQTNPTPAASDVSGLSNVIGGRRIVSSTWEAGTPGPFVSSVVDPNTVGGATFSANSDTGQDGFGEITWPISPAADLTVGGSVAFQYETTANDNGATITFTVSDSTPATGTYSFTIAPLATGLTTVPFAGFSPSIDFSIVTSVGIKIDTNVASDVSMRTILTTQPRDFGDAPDTYCTLEASNGPRHFINYTSTGAVIGPVLGVAGNVDDELDAHVSADATGDDTVTLPSAPFDDETGLTVNRLVAGDSTSNISLQISGATGNPNINAWIDFNADGDFADIGEQILTNDTTNGNGTHVYSFTPPASAIGSTFMRIRISSAALPTTDGFKGTAVDGEVEDYQVTISGEDWGDAPDTYGTTLAADGPDHPINVGDTFLGASVDSEGDGVPSVGADGDDNATSDDEDGVSGIPTVITTAGGTFPITVTLGGQSGFVSAWVDRTQTGTFDFADQFIGPLVSTPVQAVGPTVYSLVIPPVSASDPETGDKIYLRFRVVNGTEAALFFPKAGAGGSTALSGEVEDYVITVVNQLQDWGDNPDTFTTTAGPRHNIGSGDPQFGTNRDAEAAGNPSAGSDGDDNTDSPDDEDGVDFASLGTINPGTTISLPITTSGMGGSINAWMDFNGNGVYDVPSEQVLTDAAAGAGTYSITIPVTAVTGTTHARFRISSAGGDLASSGTAADGEIEDYAFTITPNLDFGDAPDTYGTLLTSNGPRHSITGPGLGTNIDNESDGVPSTGADGDDTAGSPDDEDAVTFPACLTAGIANNIPIQVNGTGKLSLWIDLNGDGDFLDSGEMLLNNVPHTGLTSFPIIIPTTATPGATYARARVIASSDPNLTSPLGAASSGEVEDYAVSICKDFGDAPDSYCTLLASDGPRHDGTGPLLGTLRDLETDAPVTLGTLADGDDNADSDDEDGVTFSNSGVFDTTSSSNQITFTLSGTADVEVYVDWNRDGDFDDVGEKYDFDNHSGGTESLSVGTLSTDGVTYVRVRAYTVGQALDSPKGNASSGEVEDYRITLSTPTLVDLLAFDAMATETGQVAINWSTGAEIDTAGFNLIRRQATEDSAASYDPVTLNSQLIPSKGTSLEGASYDYMDSPGYGTFFYQLEDIETSGRVGLHPFREVTILPTLEIGLDEDSRVNLNYVVLPGWDYEVEYKSLAEKDADWQALPDAPHNNGVVSDETGNDTSDRLYRLKASPRQ